MRSANDIPESLELTTPPNWSGTYKFEGGSRCWMWWAEGANRDVYPHFSIWENDTPNGTLARFHITYFYQSQRHKPIHVYYNVNENGTAAFSNTDAARLGGDATAGKAWVDENWQIFDLLANEFVKVAVGDLPVAAT